MSQKAGKRGRKHVEEEVDSAFKIPGTSKSKEEIPKNSKEESDSTAEANGLKGDSHSSKIENANGESGGAIQVDSNKRVIQTRSRSGTPLIKTPESTKSCETNENGGNESGESKSDDTSAVSVDDTSASTIKDEEVHETNGVEDLQNKSKDSSVSEETAIENGNNKEEETCQASQVLSQTPEMEPLILEKDEEDAIPELQFDENDVDLESEGSPSRCKTRRSQTRNISTPKTPKLIDGPIDIENEITQITKLSYVSLERLPEDNASERSTPKKLASSSNNSNIGSESQPDEIVDLDTSDTYSSVSIDNISTRAVAGSDATRNVDFTFQDSGLYDENSLSSSSRTLAETLRNLSPRRTIHPINRDYRRLALHNSLDVKGDNYTDYESVERVSSGTKRKNRSLPPDDSKRFKETPGLMSYVSSPISNFKSTLSRSSTPKFNAYDPEDIDNIKLGIESDQEKKWCSIM